MRESADQAVPVEITMLDGETKKETKTFGALWVYHERLDALHTDAEGDEDRNDTPETPVETPTIPPLMLPEIDWSEYIEGQSDLSASMTKWMQIPIDIGVYNPSALVLSPKEGSQLLDAQLDDMLSHERIVRTPLDNSTHTISLLSLRDGIPHERVAMVNDLLQSDLTIQRILSLMPADAPPIMIAGIRDFDVAGV